MRLTLHPLLSPRPMSLWHSTEFPRCPVVILRRSVADDAALALGCAVIPFDDDAIDGSCPVALITGVRDGWHVEFEWLGVDLGAELNDATDFAECFAALGQC